MSVTSWKKEFLNPFILSRKPKRKLSDRANTGIKNNRKNFSQCYTKVEVTKFTLKALECSIQKWEGLSKTNLAKHRLRMELGLYSPEVTIYDKDTQAILRLSADDCHLCRLYVLNSWKTAGDVGCEGCPLNSIGEGCWQHDSAWEDFIYGEARNTRMVAALKKAKKYWERQLDLMFPNSISKSKNKG